MMQGFVLVKVGFCCNTGSKEQRTTEEYRGQAGDSDAFNSLLFAIFIIQSMLWMYMNTSAKTISNIKYARCGAWTKNYFAKL